MKTKNLLVALIAIAALVAGSADATEISVPDHSFTPDGSTTVTQQQTNVYVANGNAVVLPAGGISTVYVVTKLTWGTGSDAHLKVNFAASLGQDRVGFKVEDDGIFRSTGDGSDSSTDLNLSQDLAGQTVVILAEFLYDVNRSTTDANDTIMNVWVNPTASATPSGGVAGGDFTSTPWNSSAFYLLEQTIENQSTPGTAGDSSITDTVILTGTDATWEKALQLAVPAPGTLVYGE